MTLWMTTQIFAFLQRLQLLPTPSSLGIVLGGALETASRIAANKVKGVRAVLAWKALRLHSLGVTGTTMQM
jgi:hypothetical protein